MLELRVKPGVPLPTHAKTWSLYSNCDWMIMVVGVLATLVAMSVFRILVRTSTCVPFLNGGLLSPSFPSRDTQLAQMDTGTLLSLQVTYYLGRFTTLQ